jgi:phosphatidylethanolamine N-methyltransferase
MCYQSQRNTHIVDNFFLHSAIHRRAKWTKVPERVKPQTDPLTWFKAALYLSLTLMIMLFSSGISPFLLVSSLGNKLNVAYLIPRETFTNEGFIFLNEKYLLLAVAVTIASPIYWNVFCRYEYYTKRLSRTAGSPSLALVIFAVSILLLSSFREWTFFRAMSRQPFIELQAVWIRSIVYLIGYSLLSFGLILSATGFYQLGIFGTYMGEYFGFMFDQKIESFPFNYFCDPMYFGSTLMHYGHSLLSLSPTGIFLSTLLGFTYWLAARCFEGPFMNAMYAAKNRLGRSSN